MMKNYKDQYIAACRKKKGSQVDITANSNQKL